MGREMNKFQLIGLLFKAKYFEFDKIVPHLTLTVHLSFLEGGGWGGGWGTVKATVFGTLNSAISNFQTRFVRTVMEVLKYCWMQETSNMQCNYNLFIKLINFHGFFRNALRCRKTGACRILVPLWYFTT